MQVPVRLPPYKLTPSRLSLLVVLGLAAFFVAMLIAFPKWTVDDAYITFRYAHNLASHGELTWNAGETPIEGYTGVMFPVFLAAMEKAGISPEVASRVISIISFILCALWINLICARFHVRPWIRGGAVALFITAPYCWTNALSGLETMPFAWLILATIHAQIIVLDIEVPTRRSLVAFWFLCLAVSLTRPEGFALAAVAGLTTGIMLRRRHSPSVRHFVISALTIYLLPAAVYYIWRWQYYDQLLPNSFYAKEYSGIFNGKSLLLMIAFVRAALVLPLLAALMSVVASSGRICETVQNEIRSDPRGVRVAAAAVVLTYFVVVAVTYLHISLSMNFSHRFFVPFLAPALFGIAIVVEFTLSGLEIRRDQMTLWCRAFVFILVGLTLGQLCRQGIGFRREFAYVVGYEQMMRDEHLAVGMYLGKTLPESEWLIVMYDAGGIPYYSGMKTVDFGLLNDPYLTTKKPSEKEQVEYFFSWKAGAITMRSYDSTTLGLDLFERQLLSDPRFSEYSQTKIFTSATTPGYSIVLYLRKDLLPNFLSNDAIGHAHRP